MLIVRRRRFQLVVAALFCCTTTVVILPSATECLSSIPLPRKAYPHTGAPTDNDDNDLPNEFSNQRRYERQRQLIAAAAAVVAKRSGGGGSTITRQEQQQQSVQRRRTFDSTSARSRRSIYVPARELAPPFPDGPCGGTLVTLAAEELYGNSSLVKAGWLELLQPRDIQVWLPPGYNTAEEEAEQRRHPVLYVHDGQNAVQDSDSWTGRSWRLVGALTRLAENGYLKSSVQQQLPLLVLLPSTSDDFGGTVVIKRRHLEYGDAFLPFATAHVDFVATVVKPMIDARFRTLASSEHTAVIGSSLGGQAALHLLLQHADKFGAAACLSPAFGPSLLARVATPAAQQILSTKKLYMDMGGDMNDQTVPWLDVLDHFGKDTAFWNPGYWWLDTQLQPACNSMRQLLDRARIPYHYTEFPGARHNERAWSQRIHRPLLHLYGRERIR